METKTEGRRKRHGRSLRPHRYESERFKHQNLIYRFHYPMVIIQDFVTEHGDTVINQCDKSLIFVNWNLSVSRLITFSSFFNLLWVTFNSKAKACTSLSQGDYIVLHFIHLYYLMKLKQFMVVDCLSDSVLLMTFFLYSEHCLYMLLVLYDSRQSALSDSPLLWLWLLFFVF